MKRTPYNYISDFYCTECGHQGISLSRKMCKQKSPGHLKVMYCLYCGKDTNHAEIRPFGSYRKEDFYQEYNLGRFVEGKKEEEKTLPKCKHECKYNVRGKCWNSNHSYSCDYRNECLV